MSSPEPRLKPDHEMKVSEATSVVQSGGSESSLGRNATTAWQAESLLAADRRTLEMMANSASLSESLAFVRLY
jgi:hypothetical protein